MERVVLFDGVCNLCNGTVQKLIQIDRKDVLKFSSLQSSYGKKILQEHQLPTQQFDSILYYKDGTIYRESNAIIEMLADLGGLWKVAKIFKIIPAFIRDKLYKTVAKNRYQWFGKQESCWLPTPELKEKFLN